MFDMSIHCDMITTIKLINISITSYFSFFVCVSRILTLSRFHLYNTVLLTRVVILYIRSPELTHPS